MPIESASDLFVAKGSDLRHWHNVSSDIIIYLRDKLDRAGEAVVYRGSLQNLAAFGGVQDNAVHGDVWTNEETGINMMWNGTDWVPVSLFRIDYDREAIEGSERGIQSGYVWTALQNVITDEEIERIVAECEADAGIQNALRDISNQLADILLDISDLNEKYSRIPEPLVSEDEGNDISKGEDGGVYLNVSESALAERVERLEQGSWTEIETVIRTDGSTIQIGTDSPQVVFIEADQDVSLSFDTLPRQSWMVKHIYIEALAPVRISFGGAVFADQSEDPQYGSEGYGILLRCTWVAGKAVLEVLDNSQAAKNAADWTI